MDINEFTVALAVFWLLTLALAGLFVGWGWALLAAGMGALIGLEAAVASERSARRRGPSRSRTFLSRQRCPHCGSPVSRGHAVCPSCFAELKINCPRCGSVIDRELPKG